MYSTTLAVRAHHIATVDLYTRVASLISNSHLWEATYSTTVPFDYCAVSSQTIFAIFHFLSNGSLGVIQKKPTPASDTGSSTQRILVPNSKLTSLYQTRQHSLLVLLHCLCSSRFSRQKDRKHCWQSWLCLLQRVFVRPVCIC